MKKMIFYKEWIKTRWYVLAAAAVLISGTAYILLGLGKAAQFKGNAFLWGYVIAHDSVLIEQLRYLPFILGGLLAVVQMLPELSGKRLKLTLHIPYPQWKTILLMCLYGIAALSVLFSVQAVAVSIALNQWVASELVCRIMKTTAVWYLAGFVSYIWSASVCLEPSWKMRTLLLVLLAGMAHLLFISPVPEAYNGFLPWLALYSAAGLCMVFHGIARFKEGVQD